MRGVLVATLMVDSACTSQTTFSCEDDEACVVDGVAGRCESNGYCSFPDEDCASGRRYGQQGPAELAGVCVDRSGGSSGGEGASTSTSSTGVDPSTSSGLESSGGTIPSSSSGTGGADASTSTGDEPEGPPANVVFVSSASLVPSETIVADADALCVELAEQAGLEGTFVSWISTSEVDAISRLDGARGWVRPDGQPFADRPADIVEGRIFYPPVLDEEGFEVRNRRVLTGTYGSGTAATTCEDWTLFEDNTLHIGNPGATFPGWSGDDSIACNSGEMLAVYCFGVDKDVPIEFEPVPGRWAFATDTQVDAVIGLEGFDALCATEAEGAGLKGTFKALIAADGNSAMSRFDTSGEPWVNTFGVPLADTAAALSVRAHLDAPYNLTAVGEPQGGLYWTGATSATQSPNGTCSNWTGGGSARRDDTDHTTDWFSGEATSCGNMARVACLQE